MLEHVVASYEADLEKLANIWLAAGADSFGVRSYGRSLAQWPPEAAGCSDLMTSVPIRDGDQALGEMYVTGLTGALVEAQLSSNALFASRLILQEQDIELLTIELVTSQDQLVALYDLVHSTRNLMSTPEIVSGVVEAVGQIFDVETAFIWVDLPDRQPIYAANPNQLELAHLRELVEQTLAQQSYFLVNDGSVAKISLPLEVDSVLAIPLMIREKKAAVLGLVNKHETQFETPDLKLLRAIGQYVESEIENVLMHEAHVEQTRIQTRMQTEMELAHKVQMGLMPQTLPDFPKLDLAAKALPALGVGGDFYDCLVQTDSQFYFTLGDVSGKGMSAALLMAMIRTTMRNTARLLPQSAPQLILDRTTESLYDDFTEAGMFATVFVGTYYPEKEMLSYANAGHAPVIYRPVGGKARLLEATGAPMGVWYENLAQEHNIPFREGDLLVVATDGLNEARNSDGEMFDYERLLQLVDALADKSSAEIVEGLLGAVTQFSVGEPQEDDQTIIVMKKVAE